MKQFYKPLPFFILFLVLTFQSLAQAPVISSFSPASGPVGSVVAIYGSNLNNLTGFTIGGKPAIVLSKEDDYLRGFVMPDAVTGPVSVTTSAGSVSGQSDFTVIPNLVPISQQGAKLAAPTRLNTPIALKEGHAVAISADGNIAVFSDPDYNNGIGAVWTFVRSGGGTWNAQGQPLTVYDNIGAAHFGSSVALSADGETIAVGGYGDNNMQGAVWIIWGFRGGWSTEPIKLKGTGNNGAAQQGFSVALSADGNTLVSGGPADGSPATGAVWVFNRTNRSWAQTGNKLVGTAASVTKQGSVVAISADGNTILSGSTADGQKGSVWAFVKNESNWTQQARLINSVSNNLFGNSVALSANGNTAVIGESSTARDAKVWILSRTGSSWSQPSAMVSQSFFSTSSNGVISADGKTVVLGGSDLTNVNVYLKKNGVWPLDGTSLSKNRLSVGANFGRSLALSADGNTSIIGDPETESQGIRAGAAIFIGTDRADLSSLKLSSGTLIPSFAPDVMVYNAMVPDSVGAISFTASSAYSGALLTLSSGDTLTNGLASPFTPLNTGAIRAFNIVVTGANDLKKTYTVSVSKPSTNTILTKLGLSVASASPFFSQWNLSPVFVGETTSYSTIVPNNITVAKLTPSSFKNLGVIKVNGVTVGSGASSNNIALNTGVNTITILVTAQNGVSTTTYTLAITRAATAFGNFSFYPASGRPGRVVTITGTGFSTNLADINAFFGPVNAEVLSSTQTTVTVRIPSSIEFITTKSHPIVLTNRATGESFTSASNFEIVAPPSNQTLSFGPKVDFATGTGPAWIMAAQEFNIIPTYKDIVTVNTANTVSTFRVGKATYFNSGSTSVKTDFASGSGSRKGALGDLDGDGKPEIITANSADNSISVLIHYSFSSNPPNDISFYRPKVDFSSGGSPSSVAVGDLDGDGKQDIIATNHDTNTFSVFRNSLTTVTSLGMPAIPVFAPIINFATGNNPTFSAMADLNMDGKKDVVISNGDDNTISIYINTSIPGSISFAPRVNFATGGFPKHFAIGDIDGDGMDDLVSANYNTNSVSILRNTSAAGVLSLANKVDVGTEISVNALALGDLNDDNKLEMVTANTEASVSVFRNTSADGTISFASKLNFATASAPSSVTIVDVTNDGNSDIISANESTNNISVIPNTLCYCAPTITSVLPLRAIKGEPVTLIGTNFLGTQEVKFNEIPVSSFTINSDTSITAILSPLTPMQGVVSVINFAGRGVAGTFVLIPSDDSLSNLTTSVGVLSPVFSPSVLAYTVSVPVTTSSLTVTPIAHPEALIYANGTSVRNSNPSSSIPLTGDLTTINIAVTAADRVNTKTYVLTVVKSSTPTITSFTPLAAYSGQTITITGTNFTGATTVSFGGTTAASFTVNSPTSITAVVGSGASGDVVVTTPGGEINRSGFTYRSTALSLLSVQQAAISPAFNQDNFDYTLPTFLFTTNVIAVTIIPADPTSAVSITGATVVYNSGNLYQLGLVTGVNTIKIKVTAANGSTSSTYTLVTTRSGGNLTSLDPKVGYPGATIKLTGFLLNGVTQVTFGGTPARSFTVSNDGNSVTAVVDSGSTGDVILTLPVGFARVEGFVYDPSPKISYFSPPSGRRGDQITITGINFTGVTNVNLGGVPAKSFVINSSTSIIAIVDSAANSGNVEVIASSDSTSKAGLQVNLYPPLVYNFYPVEATPGTMVTINGTRFDRVTGITFGGTPARSFTVNNMFKITAVVDFGSTGEIVVESTDGPGSKEGFTFLPPPPAVNSLSINYGSPGTVVEITGTNFVNVSSVAFGGIAALSYTVNSPTSIRAVVGSGVSGMVSVTTADGQGSFSSPFIFVNANQIVADESGLATLAPITPELLVISPTQALTLTIPVSVTNPTINYDLLITNGTGTLPQTTVASAIASMTIATATTVTGSSTWNGVIAAPTISSYNIPATPGQLTTTGLVIEVGDPNGSLSFNKGVRLVLPGQAGMRVGFVHSGIFTEITAVGSADNQAAGDALAPNSAFKMNVGGDLVVWTKGFSQFITFNISVDPDVALVAADKAALTNALPLPATGSVGGSSITWSTNSPGLVSPDGRIIARPAAGMPDATVTLTATIKKGLIIDTKQFAIVVPALPFTLPATNFKLAVTGESCNTSNNGSVLITATTVLPYIAVITGNGISKTFAFTGFVNIPSLSAGNYSIAITVDGRTGYKQSFDVVITEPKDLSLYVAVNPNANTISLDLAGGSMYHIDLNGTRYSTTNDKITLALSKGANSLTVSTDKECQGIINKEINLNTEAKLFPNPFIGVLNVDLGSASSSRATVDIRDLAGKSVFAKTFTNPEGSLDLDLAGVNPGVYLLKLSLDHSESVYKIIKQ